MAQEKTDCDSDRSQPARLTLLASRLKSFSNWKQTFVRAQEASAHAVAVGCDVDALGKGVTALARRKVVRQVSLCRRRLFAQIVVPVSWLQEARIFGGNARFVGWVDARGAPTPH